jgi:hypothetical protein
MFERIEYKRLNPRQKENFNFQKVAARLANYGFNCLRLSDDWQGADFLACHIDGETVLKIQLKSRLTINKKYLGKGIYIAFFAGPDLYIYDHDALVQHLEANGLIGADSITWHENGGRSWPSLPLWAVTFLADYRIQ